MRRKMIGPYPRKDMKDEPPNVSYDTISHDDPLHHRSDARRLWVLDIVGSISVARCGHIANTVRSDRSDSRPHDQHGGVADIQDADRWFDPASTLVGPDYADDVLRESLF